MDNGADHGQSAGGEGVLGGGMVFQNLKFKFSKSYAKIFPPHFTFNHQLVLKQVLQSSITTNYMRLVLYHCFE